MALRRGYSQLHLCGQKRSKEWSSGRRRKAGVQFSADRRSRRGRSPSSKYYIGGSAKQTERRKRRYMCTAHLITVAI